MRRGIGIGRAMVVDPDAPRPFETDTIQCAHCQRVMFTNALDASGKKREEGGGLFDLGGHCRLCWKQLCGVCAAKGKCEPFELKLQRMEQRGRLLEQVEKNHDPIDRLWAEYEAQERG